MTYQLFKLYNSAVSSRLHTGKHCGSVSSVHINMCTCNLMNGTSNHFESTGRFVSNTTASSNMISVFTWPCGAERVPKERHQGDVSCD